MKTKIKNLSIRKKILLICLVTNIIVLLVNITMLLGVNDIVIQLDSIYQDNYKLNELSVALDDVQNKMTEYLSSKTTDSLEAYYSSESKYSMQIAELEGALTDSSYSRMKRNVERMSEQYLGIVSQTIDAKRGRNVDKYSQRYEKATRLYGYLQTLIYSLNNESLKENSVLYSESLDAFRLFENVSALVMIFVIAGNLLIIAKVVKAIINPLTDLTNKANEVAKGNFDIELKETENTDEIGVVTRTFNQMVGSIGEYVEQIRENAETEKKLRERELMIETNLKDAQLQYLQAQINPHFLFNTLNAGAQLAMMEGADRTYEYVQIMAEFFRYNVKRGSKTVTIGEELELIDNYLYILNVRFSGDIHYEKEVDESLMDIEIPSMILQPIVENCINHGIREMMGEGKISLRVYSIDDVACISIRDNGVGMTSEMIEKMLTGEYKDDNIDKNFNGIGMKNVISRLKLFCEYDDVMSIVSEGPGTGTEFIIYLPLKGSNH